MRFAAEMKISAKRNGTTHHIAFPNSHFGALGPFLALQKPSDLVGLQVERSVEQFLNMTRPMSSRDSSPPWHYERPS